MSLANIFARTGAFEWAAIKAAQLVRGDGFLTLCLLCVITAVASALLDNGYGGRSRGSHHTLHLSNVGCAANSFLACAGIRVEHWRCVNHRGRPAKHHYRCRSGHRIPGLHAQRRTGRHPRHVRPYWHALLVGSARAPLRLRKARATVMQRNAAASITDFRPSEKMHRGIRFHRGGLPDTRYFARGPCIRSRHICHCPHPDKSGLTRKRCLNRWEWTTLAFFVGLFILGGWAGRNWHNGAGQGMDGRCVRRQR